MFGTEGIHTPGMIGSLQIGRPQPGEADPLKNKGVHRLEGEG